MLLLQIQDTGSVPGEDGSLLSSNISVSRRKLGGKVKLIFMFICTLLCSGSLSGCRIVEGRVQSSLSTRSLYCYQWHLKSLWRPQIFPLYATDSLTIMSINLFDILVFLFEIKYYFFCTDRCTLLVSTPLLLVTQNLWFSKKCFTLNLILDIIEYLELQSHEDHQIHPYINTHTWYKHLLI